MRSSLHACRTMPTAQFGVYRAQQKCCKCAVRRGIIRGAVRRELGLVFVALAIAATAQAQSALDGFDPNPNGIIRCALLQPDGKLLIGGDFTTLAPNGGAAVTRNRIARLNPDGTLDAAFNPNANSTVYALALQSDGKIIVGGAFVGASSIGAQT